MHADLGAPRGGDEDCREKNCPDWYHRWGPGMGDVTSTNLQNGGRKSHCGATFPDGSEESSVRNDCLRGEENCDRPERGKSGSDTPPGIGCSLYRECALVSGGEVEEGCCSA